jgi:hypothetical protein
MTDQYMFMLSYISVTLKRVYAYSWSSFRYRHSRPVFQRANIIWPEKVHWSRMVAYPAEIKNSIHKLQQILNWSFNGLLAWEVGIGGGWREERQQTAYSSRGSKFFRSTISTNHLIDRLSRIKTDHRAIEFNNEEFTDAYSTLFPKRVVV